MEDCIFGIHMRLLAVNKCLKSNQFGFLWNHQFNSTINVQNSMNMQYTNTPFSIPFALAVTIFRTHCSNSVILFTQSLLFYQSFSFSPSPFTSNLQSQSPQCSFYKSTGGHQCQILLSKCTNEGINGSENVYMRCIDQQF